MSHLGLANNVIKMDPDMAEIESFHIPAETLGLHVLFEPRDATINVVAE